MNSSSPGFGPGSATSFGSPLASPANMTPQYGNHMSQPMPSASPLGGMRSSSSPDGSGSDRPNATPSPVDTGTGTSTSTSMSSTSSSTSSSVMPHHPPPVSTQTDEQPPPIKRARVE